MMDNDFDKYLKIQSQYNNINPQTGGIQKGLASVANTISGEITKQAIQNKQDFGQAAGQSAYNASLNPTLSDEDKKTNKKALTHEDIQELLKNISGFSYNYKDNVPGEDSNKTHYSPMAQDLEKSDIGKSLVIDTPEGKMIDYGKGFGAILAGLADVNARLEKMEKK